MAVSEMELNEVLSRAAKLMSPEGQARIEHASRANINNFGSEGDFVRPAGIPRAQQNFSQNKPMRTDSKLPKAIQESLKNNYIDTSMSEYSAEGSVLDSLGYTPAPKQPIQENYMYETYSPAPQPSYNPTPQPAYYQPAPQQQYAPQIDYNYIRAIVNECIQTNMQKIKEELLQESSLKMVRLGGENKIQLIDNKNNLYESKLEFKRNISKK